MCVCAWLRERASESKWRGVYGLLNTRVTTGGSSSVDPIKTKQNGGSVHSLCDLTSNNATTEPEQEVSNKKGHFIRAFFSVLTVVNATRFGWGGGGLLGSSGKSPAVDVNVLMKVTCRKPFQMQAHITGDSLLKKRENQRLLTSI